MGYFKNQLIANQVELGDRVPAPKPATDHIALQGEHYTPKQKQIPVVVRVTFYRAMEGLAYAALIFFLVAVFA